MLTFCAGFLQQRDRLHRVWETQISCRYETLLVHTAHSLVVRAFARTFADSCWVWGLLWQAPYAPETVEGVEEALHQAVHVLHSQLGQSCQPEGQHAWQMSLEVAENEVR